MGPLLIAILVLLILLIVGAAYYFLHKWSMTPYINPNLDVSAPGRVWGINRAPDHVGGSEVDCASRCRDAGAGCLGYNYLPGLNYCYVVQPEDMAKYKPCIAKKAGDIGWWNISRISPSLMAYKECPSSP
jgi:hypothetical protein